MARVGPDRPTGVHPTAAWLPRVHVMVLRALWGPLMFQQGLPGMHVLEYRNILLMYW